MFTNFKRVADFAFKDFNRNKGISIAAIFVLVVTIMLVTGLVFFQGIAGYLTSQLQDKIDITAYFKTDTAEADILSAKDEIMKMSSNVKNVEYVSKDQALIAFNEQHSNDPVLSKALQEVGDNPLLPSLNITTTKGDPAQYEDISNLLQTADFSNLIDHVDYLQRKDTIQEVYSITQNINIFGIGLGVILIILAMLVVFNTIKLAIENSKDEITTMRVVGAPDWFIRGPFIIQGIIYGVIAFLICFILSGLCAFFMSVKFAIVLPGFNIFSFFLTNWWIFVLIQLGFGIAVGVISSFIVVKKYLNI